jgi:hypothetical protein
MALMNIMKNYFDGQCLKIVEKDARLGQGSGYRFSDLRHTG